MNKITDWHDPRCGDMEAEPILGADVGAPICESQRVKAMSTNGQIAREARQIIKQKFSTHVQPSDVELDHIILDAIERAKPEIIADFVMDMHNNGGKAAQPHRSEPSVKDWTVRMGDEQRSEQEWTYEFVSDLFGREGFGGIQHAHNAALAAESKRNPSYDTVLEAMDILTKAYDEKGKPNTLIALATRAAAERQRTESFKNVGPGLEALAKVKEGK